MQLALVQKTEAVPMEVGEAVDSVAEEDRGDTKLGLSSIPAQYVVRSTLRGNFHKR